MRALALGSFFCHQATARHSVELVLEDCLIGIWISQHTKEATGHRIMAIPRPTLVARQLMGSHMLRNLGVCGSRDRPSDCQCRCALGVPH